jgi:U3 small nucleolar RNA-associated protein 18
VYLWDLRMGGRCVSRFHHEDGSCSSSMTAYSPGGHKAAGMFASPQPCLAVGTESGVVSLFGEQASYSGISSNGSVGGGGAGQPEGGDKATDVQMKSMRTVMNLTTKITCTRFHPSGQLLAIASDEKRDQLKFVHLPSCSVFTNWPTAKTPLNRIESMAFSGGGEYFAAGNNAGKVLLYKLKHFS